MFEILHILFFDFIWMMYKDFCVEMDSAMWCYLCGISRDRGMFEIEDV